MPGEALIRWTIRLSLLLYVVVTFMRVQGRGGVLPNSARWIWALGAMLLLAHTLVAFHVAHHWSQSHAYEATAKGTYDVIGIDWGGGLYVNYLFTLCWIGDACWWIASPVSHARRTPWQTRLLDGFLAFIIINATIVFHSGFIRWAGIAGVLLLLSAFFSSKSMNRRHRDGVEGQTAESLRET